MKQLNRFQNWIAKIAKITDYDFDAALKQTWRIAKQVGVEEERKQKPDCIICPLYQAAHPHEMTAYERPSPTTEGKLAAQGARYKSLTRRLQNHPGTLMNHDRKMREQSKRATDGAHTSILPTFTTRKLDPLPPT